MSQFDSLFENIRQGDVATKHQLLTYLTQYLHQLKNDGKVLPPSDRTAARSCLQEQAQTLLSMLPQATTYREQEAIFACGYLFFGLFPLLFDKPSDIPAELNSCIRQLIERAKEVQHLEHAFGQYIQQPSVSEDDAQTLLTLVRETKDEYQKGRLYVGLLNYSNDIAKFSDDAKILVADFLADEIRRYLAEDPLTDDMVNNLAYIADVSKHFPSKTFPALLYRLLECGHINITYWVAASLLATGHEIPTESILHLAQDPEYANLTYLLLERAGKTQLFPPEFSSAEYLAKSDLIHWLTYPTELGKAPDEIEYLGKITYLFKKETYYVFRYRSDSDTLSDNLKNKWLIGWSSEDGGTFSNFDEYALFEKATIDATLKNIKKKLIG